MLLKKRTWRCGLKNNGLSIALAASFAAVFVLGQIPTGLHVYNSDRSEHHLPPVSLAGYLVSAPFWEVTSENWESEFLQMFVYISITTFLFQKGSAESNDPEEEAETVVPGPDSPWPVRVGGLWLKLYEHSLSAAFCFLFLATFTVHWLSSCAMENEKRAWLAQPPLSQLDHLGSAQFWFESFQNWQSEFLSMLCMVVFSIFLREKNSPESKPVAAAHAESGD